MMSDNEDNHDEIMEFPCVFPVKIMGRDDPTFRAAAMGIIERHAGPVDESKIRSRTSRDGNFLALTVTIEATSREQLDAIYEALSGHDDIIMAL